MNFNSKKLISIFVTTMILVLIIIMKFVYGGLYSVSYENSLFWMKTLSITGWITLFWSILSWKSLRKEVISLYILYLILTYFFTFGQSLLILFDLVSENRDLLNRITSSQLINAQFFTLLCLVSFHLGALMICKKPNHINNYIKNNTIQTKNNQFNLNIMQVAIKRVGIILLILSLPGFLYDTLNTLNTVVSEGYRALYGYDSGIVRASLITRIFEYTSSYFLPALICLLIAYRNNAMLRRLIFTLMVIKIFNGLYIGGRGGATILLLVVILIYHYSVRPINKRGATLLTVTAYFFLSFLAIIAKLRGLSNRSPQDYFLAFIESFGKENLFFDTLSEIGWTMFPLSAVMAIIPDSFEYFYGKSYLYALTSIVPNLGFWDIHPAKVYAGGGQWLMDTLDLYSGPGFTLIADAYRNFGWLGFFALIGFGALFGRIYSSVDKLTIYKRPDILCFVMIFANATLMSVRGDNLYIVRPLFYEVLPIYILIRLTYIRMVNSRVEYSDTKKECRES